ncbi:RNA-binding protein NOB1 [Gallus gallus]|uniref:RNA-binding protein NOB1 n=1 Tax=Gallus gallus TaxID=9031 RepID=F1NRU5_CHICK|nr:RNA-binding protein NOB1 [Gallus gallus]|eukprot:XP_414227.2 RNA-binding protein NOB1 [Gallus gallus]
MARVPHVVADAGAFLSGAALQDVAQSVYTVPEVLAEIRDRRARRRLAALPYELQLRRPRADFVRTVTEFAKRTGDFPSLSAADLQVLALTCQLQAETAGPGSVRLQPPDKVRLSSSPRHPEATLHLAGFHLPAKHKRPRKGRQQHGPDSSTELPDNAEFGSFLYWRPPLPSIEDELQEMLKTHSISSSPAATDELQNSEDGDGAEEEEDDEEESDDDNEGWITPSNLKQVQQDTGHCDTVPANVQVGCVTTDFSMQNVLLQMGLHVLAVNGMLIRQARSHILRCHGCFRTTSDMTKVFCPHCGNKTLKKVAVSVSEDGSLHMHFSRNPKVLNPRGLRYPLPAPQGGKHANNPHLVEDQPFPQQRLSRKARQKTNVFDPDYVAGVSPFAENDIYSRAANLQIRDRALGAGRRRLNPNAVTKKFVKRR